MPISSPIHQSNHLSPVLLLLRNATPLEHVKALPKAELAHHIISKPAKPTRQIAHTFFLPAVISATPEVRQLVAQLSNVQQHNILHSLQRVIRKRLTEHASLAPMHRLINHIVRVVHTLDSSEGVVEVRLLELLPVAVDVMKALRGVHGHEVGRDANVRPVLLVQGVQPQVSVALEPMVQLDKWSDGRQPGARDVAERVEEAVIDHVHNRLVHHLVHHDPCFVRHTRSQSNEYLEEEEGRKENVKKKYRGHTRIPDIPKTPTNSLANERAAQSSCTSMMLLYVCMYSSPCCCCWSITFTP